MQDRDHGQRDAVRDRGQEEVPVGVEAGADGGADEVDDTCERRPDGGLPESLTLVTFDAWRFCVVSLYGFRFPFSSYS